MRKRARSGAQVGGTSGAPDTGTTGTGSDAEVKRTVFVTVGDTYVFFIPNPNLELNRNNHSHVIAQLGCQRCPKGEAVGRAKSVPRVTLSTQPFGPPV